MQKVLSQNTIFCFGVGKLDLLSDEHHLELTDGLKVGFMLGR